MAEKFTIPRTTSHVRSTSLPSTLLATHPTDSYIDNLINKLIINDVESFSSASSICRTMSNIHDLYNNVNSSIQCLQILSLERHRKGVEDVLEGCLGLIDSVGSTNDVLSAMKGALVEVRACLRRRNGAKEKGVNAYLMSRKNIRKMADKCLRNLHKKNSKYNEGDIETIPIFDVLRKAEAINLDIIKSVLNYMSKPKGNNGKGRSLVNKLMSSKRVGLVDNNDIQRIDEMISGLELKSSNVFNDTKIARVVKELEMVESFIQEIEGSLELICRCLLKTRVSLLNVISSC
ncbi:hypothetical protein vseg_012578 [Gypsophila vaccaria]